MGSDEHRSMSSLHGGTSFYKKTAAVSIFLTFNERQSKTRQRVNPRDIRVVKPKMRENLEVPDLCPIKMYKFYKEKRPSNFCNPDDPFHLATHTQQCAMAHEDQCFKRQSIVVNKLVSIIKKMTTSAGIVGEKKITNHSARKHLFQIKRK